MTTHLWLDVSAGVAGDMLLGALADAGADLARVQEAVDAVIPGSVRLTRAVVDRGGQRATKVDVEVLVTDPPHRSWASIRDALGAAGLAERTRDLALDAFGRLARAEAHAHGVPVDEVHFHEVGALDSIADVVGTCEAVRLLGADRVTASPIAVGSGRVRAAHGHIPVPVPAVTRLVLGWPVHAAPLAGGAPPHGEVHGRAQDGDAREPEPPARWPDAEAAIEAHRRPGDHSGADRPHAGAHDADDAHDHDHEHGHEHDHSREHTHANDHAHDHSSTRVDPLRVGELATPTGVALVRALADEAGPLPALTPTALGVGAGTKDTAGWPNVVRAVLGTPAAHSGDSTPTEVVEVRANVDDLDPRLWPAVLDALLEAGALDAWLTPIHMKKGRPAHLVTALVRAPHAHAPHAAGTHSSGAARTDDPVGAVEDVLLTHTTTLGVRRSAALHRRVLDRAWRTVPVEVAGAPHEARVKLAGRAGIIATATPEFEDVAALAAAAGLPQRVVLEAVRSAATAHGLAPGGRMEA